MKKVIKLNESDIEKLVSKIIKEEKLEEVGGYDTPELSSSHGKSTMDDIRSSYEVMADVVDHLGSMKFDILDNELNREMKRFLDVVQPALEKMGMSWTRAEKKRLGSK